MITLSNIGKQFGAERVLNDVNLTLESGHTLAVLGASGSGKTTLLKVIAGLHSTYNGSICVDGTPIDDRSPQERGVVYLYQEALLFPHLTARENVAFGRELRGTPDPDAVSTMLSDIGLTAHADKYPAQLSGGQQQRVAFGRAVMADPHILLLDEPFASLDLDTRAEMQQLFVRLSAARSITTLFVTHDAKEALRVGDRFAHMRNGTLHSYESRQAFIGDASSGVQSELDFWAQIRRESASNTS